MLCIKTKDTTWADVSRCSGSKTDRWLRAVWAPNEQIYDMSKSSAQNQWLNTVIAQLHSLEGVEYENVEDGRAGLTISYGGDSREVFLTVSGTDYRSQKIQYGQLRKTLVELGIQEGQTFVAAKLPSRPMTPQMRAAREKQKAAFDAWQEVWQTLRKAEKALDVDYEITQMRDYY